MSQLRQAIAREEHNATLWAKLRPEEAARSEARLVELRAELAALQKEELAILLRHEEASRPVPQPETFTKPMGMDEHLGPGRWIYDDETHLKRPL